MPLDASARWTSSPLTRGIRTSSRMQAASNPGASSRNADGSVNTGRAESRGLQGHGDRVTDIRLVVDDGDERAGRSLSRNCGALF